MEGKEEGWKEGVCMFELCVIVKRNTRLLPVGLIFQYETIVELGLNNVHHVIGWSWIRVKFQKVIKSSLLHKCTKLEGFPTRRGRSLNIKPCWQN